MTAPSHLGKYEILEILGTGAMGVVYKGFDPGIRRTVAIKTIRRELLAGDRSAGAMLARFRNEARAAGRLSHPGIVAVYDYGEDAEVAYIAMEYVEGNSLREYFGRGARFSERDAVSIMSQLLEALAHAHERRVWHRDIKPANLIVMMNGRVKVADFGIARIEASELTQTGAVMGSPGYMAPEQYAAREIDHRADLFAAGVVFYQLLTNTKPFVGTQEQIAYAVCHSEPPKPSTVDPGHAWQRYDALLAKALAKKPEERYQSADAFLAAILDAHAAPVSPAVSEETIITEILRPAAAVDPSSPSRPRSSPPRPAAEPAPVRDRAKPARPWAWGIAAGAAALVTAAGVWLAIARKPAPLPPLAEATPAVPAPSVKAQHDQEVVFWESVRNSTNRVELEAYLAKYPNGAFAPLARARIAALAAAEAKRQAELEARREAEAKAKVAGAPPVLPERKSTPLAGERPDPEELRLWDAARTSGNPADLKAYLAKYPDGRFEPLARKRLAALAAATPPVAQRNGPAGERAAVTPKPAPRSEVVAARPPPDAARFDGAWDAQLACEAFGELPPGGPAFTVEVRAGEAKVDLGRAGQPGHLRLQGRVADDDRLALAGIAISAARSYYGRELTARFDGRFNNRSYEGRGTVGPRKCGLTMTRAGN
jgi:predicted Ser/Thr protein kinase